MFFMFVMYTFHSEILTSFEFPQINMLSPGLEHIEKLKCCLQNFPTYPHISGMLEKYKLDISMYSCHPIQGTRS